MIDNFYVVHFYDSDPDHYFHSFNKAINYIWTCYMEELYYKSSAQVIETDRRNLFEHGYIVGYAYVTDGVFED